MKVRGPARLGVGTLAAAVCAVVGVASAGAQGGSPADGTITGQVTDDSGAPLEGVCVAASPEPRGDGEGAFFEGGEDTTDADGRYSVELTPVQSGTPVSFRVEFRAARPWCPGHDDLMPQFWNGKRSSSDADLISLAEGETRTGIDAQLREGGRITGQVVGPDGEPGADVCVMVGNWPISTDGGLSYTWSLERDARTDSSGRYEVIGLRDGNHSVHFRDCGDRNWLPQSYDGKRFSKADPVATSEGTTTTGIDARMQRAGAITGTVRDTDGERLEGICVTAVPRDGVVDSFSDMMEGIGPGPGIQKQAVTGADGTYRVDELRPHGWGVVFGQCPTPGPQNDYVVQAWNGKPASSADRIDVGNGQTVTGIDAVMRSGDRISGEVTSYAGEPLGGMCVRVASRSGDVYVTPTRPDGSYRTEVVAEGEHVVLFTPCAGMDSPFAPQYFDGQASVDTAAPVQVAPGEPATNIDGRLVAAAKPCVVPDIAGKKLGRAKGKIADTHCSLGDVARKRSSKPRGKVLRQRPTDGSQRPRKTEVRVVVSAGSR